MTFRSQARRMTAVLVALLAAGATGRSQEALRSSVTGSVFMVVLPDRIDGRWSWLHYTDVRQAFAQARLESALESAGFGVLDLKAEGRLRQDGRIEDCLVASNLMPRAQALGATHVAMGEAVATRRTEHLAYGLHLYRYDAAVAFRVYDAAGGSEMASVQADSTAGGPNPLQAARQALREASLKASDKLVKILRQPTSAAVVPAPTPAPAPAPPPEAVPAAPAVPVPAPTQGGAP